MKTGDLGAAVRAEGDRLANAATEAGADAPIPTCPEWRMRDLVRHQGEVHRWATAIVRDARSSPDVPPPDFPDDSDLVSWFREGCPTLVDVFERADPGLECFAFLPAPSPLAFWARRQAHETGIHRVDAQSALGSITPFATDIAVDGIEEMLFGFASRSRSRLRSESSRTLVLRAADADATWLVRVTEDAPTVSRVEGATADADCAVTAGASDLFMLLWNRAPRDVADVHGDVGVLDVWQEKMQISWS